MIDKNKPTISILNQSTLVTDDQLKAMLPAFQTQITRDFSPAWGLDATLVFADRHQLRGQADNSMQVIIKDVSDEAGDLGYHFDENGLPITYVFAKDSMADNAGIAGLSTTISHELLEMLADPGVNLYALGWYKAKGSRRSAYISYEVCDPVEAGAYKIGETAVSNFVFPEWFEGDRKRGSVQFDYQNAIAGPFELAAGGYIEAYIGTRSHTVYGAAARTKAVRHRKTARETRPRAAFVCPNCNQVKLGKEGVWPCELCHEPVKWSDGSQLNWDGTAAEVAEHQRVHDAGLVCVICAGEPDTRIIRE
jgi:ribosomal protein L37AE/L43A